MRELGAINILVAVYLMSYYYLSLFFFLDDTIYSDILRSFKMKWIQIY